MMLPSIPKHQLKTEISTNENAWLNMKTIDVGLKTQENDDDIGMVENPDEVVIQKRKKNRNSRSHMGKSYDFNREKHIRN